MKSIFTSAIVFLSVMFVQAQEVELPAYKLGHYYSDTLYSYVGSLPTKGIGSIGLDGVIADGYVLDGVNLIIVFDSVPYPEHVLVDDGSGRVHLNQGDVKSLPISMEVYRGVIGFHIIAQGVPQIASQPYPCELHYAFTLGDTFGMGIYAEDEDCEVDPINSVYESSDVNELISIYPNPVTRSSVIDLSKVDGSVFNFECFNQQGVSVFKQYSAIEELGLDSSRFESGVHFFTLINQAGRIWRGEFIVE